jgi:hypothetical protein
MYTITELGLIDNHVQIQRLHVTVLNSHMQPLYLYMIVQTPEIANSMTFAHLTLAILYQVLLGHWSLLDK